MAYQATHVEEAIWTAFRALEETAALAERDAGLTESAARYAEKREEARARAKVIREALEAVARPLSGDSPFESS